MAEPEEITTSERRAQIVLLLEKANRVEVSDLSERFGVSVVTIRNDLGFLEENGLLIRTRGGAIQHTKVAYDLALSDKIRKNEDQKRRIGLKAAELIHDGDTIILDSGTTTVMVARQLNKFKRLTVITHALNIAMELAGNEHVELIMPGGLLRNKSFSLVGSMAEENLRNYFADILFLGVDGFDVTHGITTPGVAEAQVNRMMAEIAQKIIVVTDSSKFGRRSLAHILPISKIDVVITDSGIPDEDHERLIKEGVKVLIA